jgi:hypothetical protein
MAVTLDNVLDLTPIPPDPVEPLNVFLFDFVVTTTSSLLDLVVPYNDFIDVDLLIEANHAITLTEPNFTLDPNGPYSSPVAENAGASWRWTISGNTTIDHLTATAVNPAADDGTYFWPAFSETAELYRLGVVSVASPTYVEGASITFEVQPNPSFVETFAGPGGVQWQKDSVDIPGATSWTYNIPSAVIADTGTYSLVVVDNPTATSILGSVSIAVNAAEPGNPVIEYRASCDFKPTSVTFGLPITTTVNTCPGGAGTGFIPGLSWGYSQQRLDPDEFGDIEFDISIDNGTPNPLGALTGEVMYVAVGLYDTGGPGWPTSWNKKAALWWPRQMVDDNYSGPLARVHIHKSTGTYTVTNLSPYTPSVVE